MSQNKKYLQDTISFIKISSLKNEYPTLYVRYMYYIEGAMLSAILKYACFAD